MSRPFVMTVRGPVDPTELGRTLIHEHLQMDARSLLKAHGYRATATGPFDVAAASEARWNPGAHPDNYRLDDPELIAHELHPFVEAGGRTIVDVTPPELGRNPGGLRRISEMTGVHVVMGTGHYLKAVHPNWLEQADEEIIAERIVAEWRSGVGPDGIRPGIIGEIGTGDPIDPAERRVLRGAALAAGRTGMSISVHLQPWGRTGVTVLDELEAGGADPDRIILGHLNTAHDDQPYLASLLRRGAWLAFDLFGFDHSLLGLGRYPPSDADVATTMVRLVEAGYGEQLLLSGDLGVRSRLRAWGGWGYDHLLRHVVPLLRARGLDAPSIDRLLIENPARVLTIEDPLI
jgi:phosphotriesterase-related protein